MNDDLSRYIEIKNIVLDIYSTYNITTLPVSMLKICRAMNISVLPYKEAWQSIVDLGLERECIERKAFALRFIEDDRWFIFYNCQTNPRVTIKYYLAHELGHILLGHEMTENIKTKQAVFSKQNPHRVRLDIFENEASMFAIHLLAPVGVLNALSIHESPDMEYLCGITLDANFDKVLQMEDLYHNSRSDYDGYERRIVESFHNFITSYPLIKY